uniref:SFRICE_030006 n=1 Tax=Spodoptera frugiperda TaxID=7108 RepID=A0A2H1VV95_SPOFR
MLPLSGDTREVREVWEVRECCLSGYPSMFDLHSPVPHHASTQTQYPLTGDNSLRDPRQSFMSLGRAGLQCSGVFMVVSTVYPGLQKLQRVVIFLGLGGAVTPNVGKICDESPDIVAN